MALQLIANGAYTAVTASTSTRVASVIAICNPHKGEYLQNTNRSRDLLHNLSRDICRFCFEALQRRYDKVVIKYLAFSSVKRLHMENV